MEYIIFGNGVKIPVVGLGTFPLHGETLNNTLNMAIQLGYNYFDTAHLYKNEAEIGHIIKDLNKQNIIISSKICATQYLGNKRYLNLNRQSVKTAFSKSCKQLGVKRLSIYLLHSCFHNFEKAYQELIDLYQAGNIDVIGVSNANITHLKQIYKKCGVYPMIVQVEIHPYCNRRELVEFCNENGITIIAHSPFAHGDAMGELLSNIELQKIAQLHNKTIAQIILRWIIQQGMIVIPRSTNYMRLKDNINIFDFNLSDAEMRIIDSLNRDQSYGVRSANDLE